MSEEIIVGVSAGDTYSWVSFGDQLALIQKGRSPVLFEPGRPPRVMGAPPETPPEAHPAAPSIEEALEAALAVGLPHEYLWGEDALEGYRFGKQRAVAAIRERLNLGKP